MLSSASGTFALSGIRGDELPLRGDRAAEILLRVLRVADPVLRGRRERALRIRLDERLEAGDRGAVAAGLELVERGVVGTLLVGGRRRRSGARAA